MTVIKFQILLKFIAKDKMDALFSCQKLVIYVYVHLTTSHPGLKTIMVS